MAGFNNEGDLYDAAFFAEIGQDTLGNTGNGSTMPDRSAINANLTPVSGTLYAQLVYLPAGTVITRLTIRIATGSTGLTNWWLGITNSSFTVVAETVDQGSTALVGFTNVTVALSTPYVVPISGLFYYYACQVGTTPALLAGQNTTASPSWAIKPPHNWTIAGLAAPAGVGFTFAPTGATAAQTVWILST